MVFPAIACSHSKTRCITCCGENCRTGRTGKYFPLALHKHPNCQWVSLGMCQRPSWNRSKKTKGCVLTSTRKDGIHSYYPFWCHPANPHSWAGLHDYVWGHSGFLSSSLKVHGTACFPPFTHKSCESHDSHAARILIQATQYVWADSPNLYCRSYFQ